MQQARVFISGFVQGVGFRYFVRNNAVKMRLYGWVRNTSDGRVEALVQGDKKNIEKLITFCNKGPFLAEVREVAVEWENIGEEYNDFSTQKTA